jgi:hypothetical protein
VLADLGRAPFAAPEAHRLAELGLGRRELAAAVRAGALLRVTDGIYLRPGADADALPQRRANGYCGLNASIVHRSNRLTSSRTLVISLLSRSRSSLTTSTLSESIPKRSV